MTEKRNGNFSVAAELVLSAAIGVGRPDTARDGQGYEPPDGEGQVVGGAMGDSDIQFGCEPFKEKIRPTLRAGAVAHRQGVTRGRLHIHVGESGNGESHS